MLLVIMCYLKTRSLLVAQGRQAQHHFSRGEVGDYGFLGKRQESNEKNNDWCNCRHFFFPLMPLSQAVANSSRIKTSRGLCPW